MKTRFPIFSIICFLFFPKIVPAQNDFRLDDPENRLTKKEKAIFEYAISYESAFYNRIFSDKIVNFSQIKFTIIPDYVAFLVYLANEGIVHQNLAGFYSPSRRELVVCTDKKFNNSFLKTCFHELSHAFVHLHIGENSIPVWLNEGLAEYLGNMEYSANQVTHQTNKYLLARVKTLFELKDLNLAEFIGWDYQKFVKMSLSQENYGYSVAYCMALLLVQKDDKEVFALFRNLVGSTAPIKIFDQYYHGGFAQFEKDFIAKYGT